MEDTTRQRKERALWDKQAPRYDRQVMGIYRQAYDLSITKIRDVLKPDHRVLEIGCGTGIIALGIAPFAREVVATDLSPEMIAVAQAKAAQSGASNLSFMVGDGYALDEKDESFDIVLIFNTLHVVKEPQAMLREAYRLLKPGGHLVTATDCYGEPVPFPINLKLAAQKVLKWLGIISFMRYYRQSELEQLFVDASFQLIDTGVLHPAPVNAYVLAKKTESGT